MKDLGSELIGRNRDSDELRPDEFWAVKDVSFELRRGECLGLIGRNGAGKTTLLRMLNGLIKPDKGRIEMRGRVGALIALGAGFNPILTGRENIYVNAAVFGLSKKETDEKLEEIIDFAELEDFIDAPVQSYSSGMQVRLGFSVSAALRQEILLLDEVLAVGDTRFRAKCLKRIKAIQKNSGGIILVTHALEQIAHFCNRAVLMDSGNLISEGKASSMLNYYIQEINLNSKPLYLHNKERFIELKEVKNQKDISNNSKETRWGDHAAIITNICLMQEKKIVSKICQGVLTELVFSVLFNKTINEPIYGLTIKSIEGGIIFNTNSRQLLGISGVPKQNKYDRVRACFSFLPYLDTGDYLISVGIASDTLYGVMPHDRRYDCISFKVDLPYSITGEIEMNPNFHLISDTPDGK